MVTLGAGDFTYQVSGEDWGNIPEDWTYKEATAVAVDSDDNVYVFNRGTHPMVIFNSDGDVLRTWGDGIFANPHGVTIGPDGSVYCVDNGDHTVRQFAPNGKLLMTLGQPNQPASPMSGEPFNRPTHLAIDPHTGDLYVADGYSNAQVHKFTPDGRHLFSWGSQVRRKGNLTLSTTSQPIKMAGYTLQTVRTIGYRYSLLMASTKRSG